MLPQRSRQARPARCYHCFEGRPRAALPDALGSRPQCAAALLARVTALPVCAYGAAARCASAHTRLLLRVCSICADTVSRRIAQHGATSCLASPSAYCDHSQRLSVFGRGGSRPIRRVGCRLMQRGAGGAASCSATRRWRSSTSTAGSSHKTQRLSTPATFERLPTSAKRSLHVLKSSRGRICMPFAQSSRGKRSVLRMASRGWRGTPQALTAHVAACSSRNCPSSLRLQSAGDKRRRSGDVLLRRTVSCCMRFVLFARSGVLSSVCACYPPGVARSMCGCVHTTLRRYIMAIECFFSLVL